jgi:hypothetical protein
VFYDAASKQSSIHLLLFFLGQYYTPPSGARVVVIEVSIAHNLLLGANQTYQAWSARNSNMQVQLKSLDTLLHQISVRSRSNIQNYQDCVHVSATYHVAFN